MDCLRFQRLGGNDTPTQPERLPPLDPAGSLVAQRSRVRDGPDTLATLVASTLGDDARRLLEKLEDIGDNYDRTTATTTSARKLLEVVVEGLVAIELKALHMSAGLKSGPH